MRIRRSGSSMSSSTWAIPLKGGQLNLDSAKKGNLGAEFFSIWVEPEANKGHYARRTLE